MFTVANLTRSTLATYTATIIFLVFYFVGPRLAAEAGYRGIVALCDPYGLFVYREITPPERLVFISSFSDENGGLTRHPMAQTWPIEMLSTFAFEDVGGKTRFTVKWSAHNATEEERKTFDAGHASMTQGWSGTLEQLEAYLAKAKA